MLVELFAAGEAERYVDTFGASGMTTLQGKLRDFEAKMGAMLASKMSPEQIKEILGDAT